MISRTERSPWEQDEAVGEFCMHSHASRASEAGERKDGKRDAGE